MTVILCFGDSNTWGCRPIIDRALPARRYRPADRWPDVLARALGPDFTVVAEGLNGRTTILDDPVEGVEKNGKRALLPVIESNSPVDLVVIMLGTNDLKSRFGASAPAIAAGAAELAALAMGTRLGPDGEAPRALIVAPPPTRIRDTEGVFGEDFDRADQRSTFFAREFGEAAATVGAAFLDAGLYITSSEVDGIHLSAGSQRVLGETVAHWVLAHFGPGEPS
jgi:lysophospholipase L1-like esterase